MSVLEYTIDCVEPKFHPTTASECGIILDIEFTYGMQRSMLKHI